MLWRTLSLYVVALVLLVIQPVSQAQSNRIVYGLTLQPSGFDPHINRSSELGIPLRQVYDTLVYRHPETRAIVPGLAESWEISPDGLTYTFHLKAGVSFHDGTVFNAEAVAANLDRITAVETASQWAVYLLGTYDHYVVVDSQTIQLVLSEPYAPLMDSLAQVYLGMASPTALSAYSNNRYQFHQVGTGPFTFDDFVPGDHIYLSRNPDYAWGPEFYGDVSDQSLDEIEFRFFADPPTRSLALESGEAQIMGELLPVDARLLSGSSSLQLIPQAVPGQPLQFLMNSQRFPTDSRGFRQALLFGANREAIVDAVFQQFSPVAWGPLSASSLYYDTQMRGLYDHDISQALGLMEAASYTDSDNDGFRDIAGVTLQVDVIVPPWGLLPEVATLLQDQWRTIGVRTVLRPVPTFGALLDEVQRGEYNLVAFNAFGLDPVLLNEFYLSSGATNWTGYASPELDTLLMDATHQTDDGIRRGLYAQVQRIIMNEALVLPIRDQVNLNASGAIITDLSFDPYGWFPLLHDAKIVGP